MPQPDRVDPRVPRFNQGVTGVLLLLAFLLDQVWLVPLLGIALGAGAFFGPRWNLWGLVFVHGVKPVLKLGPPPQLKEAAPPRFAMTLGFIFLGAATVAFYGLPVAWAATAGWVLALTVSALALLAAVTNICVGCEVYVFLQKLRAPAA